MTQHATPREIITVDSLVQTISGQEILRGFSLKVYEGETLVLLGRSGGGACSLVGRRRFADGGAPGKREEREGVKQK